MIIPVDEKMFLGIRGTDGKGSPGDDTIFLSQVHGTEILFDPPQNTQADGLICSRGTGFPGLRVADCLPIFAVWKNRTGAAHAGWRGLAGGIVEKLILSVNEPLELLILGPCICADCYEVGETVRMAVAEGDPGGIQGHPPGRVDLRGSALRRVRKLLPSGFRVVNLDLCTLESDSLHSYRRNGTGERNLLWLAESSPCSHIQHPYHESVYYPPRGE